MIDETERKHTAIHEAGHAVLQVMLGIGNKGVSIVPNYADMESGHALHGGGWPEKGSDADNLLIYAEDAFWLRHAIAMYAGKESVRQFRPQDDSETGAESDRKWALDALSRITDDPVSLDLWMTLAKRRCELLVEHYRLVIETVAFALLDRCTLSGDEVSCIVKESMRANCITARTW